MSQNRRNFLKSISMLAGGAATLPAWGFGLEDRKLKIVLVGTGVRGISFWGKRLLERYPDLLEFVGLCDINQGRVSYAKKYMKVKCPTFTDLEEMIINTKPDLVIVASKDSVHHKHIIKGLQMGCDVLTEKPLTIDEKKCQAIIDAERSSDKNLIVGFNYRWSPYVTKIKELLMNDVIGKVTSVDFNWYLNTFHGASYFRRWHGLRQAGGTLLVHKSTHHFDLLNWWLDSDPEKVFAYGALEHYGSNGAFRGDKCRTCEHKKDCKFYWDITENKRYVKLFVENEHYDGYIRDSCVFRNEINIYDKMSAQIKYANDAVVNYSLTTYSPYEGWKIAFNGMKGRIEAWHDIPFMGNDNLDQSQLHSMEMNQGQDELTEHKPIIVHKNWGEYKTIQVPIERTGHGGGDIRLHNKIFKNPHAADPYEQSAGLRDGAMSILTGIAARKSIELGEPVNIASLTDLQPRKNRL